MSRLIITIAIVTLTAIFVACGPPPGQHNQKQGQNGQGQNQGKSEDQKKIVEQLGNRYIQKLADMGLRTIGREILVRDNVCTIVVENAWHFVAYQIRLQNAQNMDKAWQNIYSPDHKHVALISIVDINSNEVGGTGVLGTWVQKN